jgi:hypothetical protein
MLNGAGPRDPGGEAAENLLAKALSETKRGEWSFAAVVLIAEDGSSYVDFKGLVKLMPTANLCIDHLKDQVISQFMQQNAPKVLRAALLPPAGLG